MSKSFIGVPMVMLKSYYKKLREEARIARQKAWAKKKKNKKVTRVVDSIFILCYNITTTGKDHIKKINTTGNRIIKGID